MENQLTILSESLDKKLEVLQKIREYNKRQEEIFSAEEVDMSLFDDAVEEKQYHCSTRCFTYTKLTRLPIPLISKGVIPLNVPPQHRKAIKFSYCGICILPGEFYLLGNPTE